MKRQTDPYGKAMMKEQRINQKNIHSNNLGNLFKYIFFCSILLVTSSLLCCKDQFVVSYFSTS